MAKRCLVPGCHRKLTDGRRHALCAGHWRRLPMAHRKVIWGAWDDAQANGVPASHDFDEALSRAVDHLDTKGS